MMSAKQPESVEPGPVIAGGSAIAVLADPVWPNLPLPALPPPPFLAFWFPSLALPSDTAQAQTVTAGGWLASPELRSPLAAARAQDHCSIAAIAQSWEQQQIPFRWYGLTQRATELEPVSSQLVAKSAAKSPILHPSSRVLALVPHYRCERWLRRCLQSLVSQTRPPEAIAVLDDASPQPPLAIVQAFPTVTLLTTGTNVGPYRLVQQAIDDTDYDAYLFQDADDWSSGDRLARLLQTAAQTGAELLGTQILQLRADVANLTPIGFPLAVNQAVASKPGHPLSHPTSLVSRALVQRLGGFATGLRFGGDTEFLLRAVWQARVVNVPIFGYFRRQRPDSLTTAAATGLGSPARNALTQQLKALARQRQRAGQQGNQPNLRPLTVTEPIALQHLTGPRLAGWRS
ncbi:MAG: glycosyltransferase [Spirulinaceae cyanobacterium SM2_1_0]|nr:glycosyltransferase [Spirulinaceae cyanobacterium SM2_1_0]